MGARGPKSAAELAVVHTLTRKAPPAPDRLTKDQAEIWNRLAASKPPQHFAADDLPLLAELCRAYDAADKIAVRIDKHISTASAETLQTLMGLRDKESRRAVALATKLRMTSQSRYDKGVAASLAKQAGRGAKPWGEEDPGDEFFRD